jgi:hypothetical protein
MVSLTPKIFLAVFLSPVLLAAAPAAAPSADAAWRVAEASWASGQAYKPARMSFRSEEVDSSGSVVAWEESEYALAYAAPSSKPTTTLIRAVKDGKDYTSERRAKGGGNFGGRGGSFDFVPFSPEVAGRVTRSPPRARADGGFDLDYKVIGKSGSEGTVAFGPEGSPRGLSYRLSPLPAFVYAFDGAAVFGTGPGGVLLAERLSFKVEGGMLGIRKRYRITVGLYEWIKSPPA